MSIRRCVGGVAVALVVLIGLTVAPSQADMRPDPKPMSPDGTVLTAVEPRPNDDREPGLIEDSDAQLEDTIEWTYYDTKGKVTGGSGGERVLTDTGSGGTVKNSGCIRVWVNNKKYSPLGDHLFTHRIETYWCWNRANKTISNVDSTVWRYTPDFTCYEWVGQVNSDRRFYDWAAGYAPKSGYLHYRQGHVRFDCNPPGTGWIGLHVYPETTIRSHCNGTWTWATRD